MVRSIRFEFGGGKILVIFSFALRIFSDSTYLKRYLYYNKKKMNDQKNRICIIYIGAASNSPTSGQLTNIRHESAMGIQFISVDPEHINKKENI